MTDESPEKPASGQNKLVNLLMEREFMSHAFPTKYIAFVDMLGFSALTKRYPGSMTLVTNDDYSSLVTGTSKSAERFGRFHAVLDRMAADQADASHPERMMIFSDCAFTVYDNPLQATVSLAEVMRTFLTVGIPVRIGISRGTCHFERFGIDTYQGFSVTRSMFYGSGIVYATEAEKGGQGCRIFLHRSLDEGDLARIRERYPILELATPTEVCAHELNYLHEEQPAAGVPVQEQADHRIWFGLAYLRSEWRDPVDLEVLKHYDDSFAAFNAMRKQRDRESIPPPVFNPGN